MLGHKSRQKGKNSTVNWLACIPLAALIGVFWVYAATAQTNPQNPPTTESIQQSVVALKVGLDTLWVVVASFLVFFMNAGFALVESGFCRRKNAVNILTKNLIVFAIATIAYWAVGFGFMYGDNGGNTFIGMKGFFLQAVDNSPATLGEYKGDFPGLSWTGIPLEAKFLFQLVFAATAATIVSGAVAERIKFLAFLLFSFVLVALSYPITGHWVWGGGWLANLAKDAQGTTTGAFFDFAGSTVVHSVGGWAALIGAALLGARAGRYTEDGKTRAIPGHSMSLATLGCLILWLGWFGFNPGSTMAADGRLIAHIALTTNMGASAGGIAATIVAWLYLGKPDLSMIVNGILAGLVSVTASCAWITLPSALIIGAIGGVIVVFAVGFFDNLRIDDPVGATSVHLCCGIWGTLAVGLFAVGQKTDIGGGYILQAGAGPKAGLFFGGGFEQLLYQTIGAISVGGFTVAFSFMAWYVISLITSGIRVEGEEEFKGLDISEHGMEAYSGFLKEGES
ncbi:ammonium transporter [Pseudanabaena sp. UWO310]|uniref:ammonium transporter n=1 Tax=Pseudanabaena sp. UWO310 TaxID=2480795 RepID=UPI00115959AA|nr:ammonium transporter [Pseudanabaena sp. UWO310]TYQ31950.1 ammonium transporter [Pseudanabaena sp. UWO310]